MIFDFLLNMLYAKKEDAIKNPIHRIFVRVAEHRITAYSSK